MERLTGRHETGIVYVPQGMMPEALDRLAYYEDLEEQGRLFVADCNVGDPCFCIWQYNDFMGLKEEPFIEETTVAGFIVDELRLKIIPATLIERENYWYHLLDIRLTREEAEAALKKEG